MENNTVNISRVDAIYLLELFKSFHDSTCDFNEKIPEHSITEFINEIYNNGK